MKKIISLLLVLITLALVGCKNKEVALPEPKVETFYSLTLKNEKLKVINDIDDLAKIPEKTPIQVKVELNENEEIKSFFINDKKQYVEQYFINNIYSFIIESNVSLNVEIGTVAELPKPKYCITAFDPETRNLVEFTDYTEGDDIPIYSVVCFRIKPLDISKKVARVSADDTVLTAKSTGLYQIILKSDTKLKVEIADKEIYTLDLPEYPLNKVAIKSPIGLPLYEGTLITLTFTLDAGESIYSFRVNEKDKTEEIENNEFSFIITRDTKLEISIKT